MTLSALRKKRLALDRRYTMLRSGLEVLVDRVAGTERMLEQLRQEIADIEAAITAKEREAR